MLFLMTKFISNLILLFKNQKHLEFSILYWWHRMEKEINKINKISSNVYLVKDNLTNLISICDVLITDISGAALEFIYFQKK